MLTLAFGAMFAGFNLCIGFTLGRAFMDAARKACASAKLLLASFIYRMERLYAQHMHKMPKAEFDQMAAASV